MSREFTTRALFTPADCAIVCGMLRPWIAKVDGGTR